MKSKFLYGGMATATAVVLAVVTYRTMPVGQHDAVRTAKEPGTVGAAQRGAAGAGSESSLKKTDPAPATPQAMPAPAKPERLQGREDDAVAALVPAPKETAPATEFRRAEPEAASRDRIAGAAGPAATPPSPARPPQHRIDEAQRARPGLVEKFADTGRRKSEAIAPVLRSVAPNTAVGTPPGDLPPPAQYEATGRDQFAHVDENAVKRVAQEPVSTFSIDVDTASYAFVRRMLLRGVLPQKDAVRVEELVNYFDYDYPLPDTREQPFRPSVTVMPSPWKEGNKLVQIGIKGYELKGADKPKSNLVFLLDVSGSMNAPDKLPLMVNSMKLLLDTLKPEDSVAIVVYAGAAGTVLEPTPVAEKGKILAALDNLRAGGSTAGAAGIRQAYALAESTFDKKAVNRVILATDGDFNVGITNREELKDFVERKRKTGVFLSVLGFGQGNLNDRLMQDLAQNGNGVAAYIDTLGEARKVLVEEASGMLFPIAKDVKIQVEFNPKTVAEYRLIGYETRALKREDFNNDNVDAGDIGAGHTVTAIYEITPVGGDPLVGETRYEKRPPTPVQPIAPEFSDEYAFLKIRYKLPDADSSKLITTPITTALEDGVTGRPLREAHWAAAVAGFGQILKGGTYTGSYSYDDVAKLAASAKGDDPFGYRAEFINLVRLAKSASAMPRR